MTIGIFTGMMVFALFLSAAMIFLGTFQIMWIGFKYISFQGGYEQLELMNKKILKAVYTLLAAMFFAIFSRILIDTVVTSQNVESIYSILSEGTRKLLLLFSFAIVFGGSLYRVLRPKKKIEITASEHSVTNSDISSEKELEKALRILKTRG